MIGGIVLIFTVIWFYQTAMREKTENMLFWVAAAAVAFLIVQYVFVYLNVYILETFRGSESTQGYERDILSVGDRKNEGGFEGFKGVFLSVFFELMPPLAAFLAVAVIRAKFILKGSFAPASLFSGIKGMFVSIKDSFKNTAVNED
jgi:hypothetical protein